MKSLSCAQALFCALLLLVAPATGHSAPADLPRDVLREINRLRANPREYAAYLESLRPSYRPNGLRETTPGGMLIRTREGVSALNEAIRSLRGVGSLPPISYCDGLASAARDHALEQSRSGQTGHAGLSGSSPFNRMERYGSWLDAAGENIAYGALTARDIVANLVIDDGVPGRGHRVSLLKSTFGVAGVGISEHPRYRMVCVIDLAGGFVAR